MMNLAVVNAVNAFCAAAIERADFGDGPRDELLHAEMGKAVTALRAAGVAGVDALRSLLQHESPRVRLWAASELLAGGELSARSVLEALTAMPGIAGFNAEMTLRDHESGRLRSPFARAGD